VPEGYPAFGGQGRAPLGLVDLLRYAGRLYGAHVRTLVPAFVVAFIGLRELLLVLLAVAQSPLVLLLVAALVQAVIPAFVGSLLVAAAIPVMWGKASGLREAWGALADQRGDIYRAARWSVGLALFFAITLGSVGIMIQPMVLGPPLLIHEVVLQRHRLDRAWERTRQMIERDSRQLVYLLAIPAAIGLLVAGILRAFGVLSGDIPGVLRGVLYFAVQGALLGAAIPLVVAVGVLLYADMASTLGDGEAT
jgi:hypothetical protein